MTQKKTKVRETLDIPPVVSLEQESHAIPVKQHHIDAGECSRPANCAVALAANEYFGLDLSNGDFASIGTSIGFVYKGDEVHDFDHDGADFIQRFDQHKSEAEPTFVRLELKAVRERNPFSPMGGV